MDRQTTLDMNADPSAHRLAARLAGVGHDLATLFELQWQLLTAELQAGGRVIAVCAGLLAVSGAILFAAMPVMLFGLAAWLAEAAAWPVFAALIVVSLAAVLAATVLVWATWRHLRAHRHVVSRSMEELRANLAAIKEAMRDDLRRNQF
jgi:hypothetical protein